MTTLVPAQEGDLKYCLETGTIFQPIPGKPGEFNEDVRKFTFHRAYVENPWGTTVEERFQTKNVFDAPTKHTALRLARRFEAILPDCTCVVELEENFAMYRHSHTPWFVVVRPPFGPPLRFHAGRHAHFIFCAGWEHWKGEIKMQIDDVCPGLKVNATAEEPRDW